MADSKPDQTPTNAGSLESNPAPEAAPPSDAAGPGPVMPNNAPKKKMSGLVIGLLIILAIILVGSGSTYAYYKATGKKLPWEKSQQPTQTTKSGSTKSGNWKSYSSDQLKFSFSYPTDWTYTDSGYSNEHWTQQRSYNAEFTPTAKKQTVSFYLEVNPWTVSASPLAHVYDYYEQVSTEPAKIDNVDATKSVWRTTARGSELEGGDAKGIDYSFSHGTDQFRLHFAYKTADETAQLKNINEIITSWKFTGPGSGQ